MKKIWILIFLSCALVGCAGKAPSADGTPGAGSEQQVSELKTRMNDVFAGLEMYAADNTMTYPDSLEVLVPKYLDSIPDDPLSGKPIVYEKTEQGFVLSATGDYTSSGAEPGYPKMNQDGFYVKSAEGFPKVDDLPEE